MRPQDRVRLGVPLSHFQFSFTFSARDRAHIHSPTSFCRGRSTDRPRSWTGRGQLVESRPCHAHCLQDWGSPQSSSRAFVHLPFASRISKSRHQTGMVEQPRSLSSDRSQAQSRGHWQPSAAENPTRLLRRKRRPSEYQRRPPLGRRPYPPHGRRGHTPKSSRAPGQTVAQPAVRRQERHGCSSRGEGGGAECDLLSDLAFGRECFVASWAKRPSRTGAHSPPIDPVMIATGRCRFPVVRSTFHRAP